MRVPHRQSRCLRVGCPWADGTVAAGAGAHPGARARCRARSAAGRDERAKLRSFLQRLLSLTEATAPGGSGPVVSVVRTLAQQAQFDGPLRLIGGPPSVSDLATFSTHHLHSLSQLLNTLHDPKDAADVPIARRDTPPLARRGALLRCGALLWRGALLRGAVRCCGAVRR